LGKNGVDQIKRHPFFASVDWDKIREMEAPFVPQLDSDIDTKYFDVFEPVAEEDTGSDKNHWHGFTFSSAALFRLSLGTWGKGGTLKLFKSPFEQDPNNPPK
jgi:hypothetical protein